MTITPWIKLLIGAILIAAVLWLKGNPAALWGLLSKVGIGAVIAAMACHGASMVICGLGWWITAGRPRAIPAWRFVCARWIRDGVGQLLPVLPLAGEIVGARYLAQAGLGAIQSSAVTVVDITAEIMTQAIFSLIGAMIWVDQDASLTFAGAAVAMSLPIAAALILAQKFNLAGALERLAERIMPESWQLEGISDSIHALYADKPRFYLASAFHLSAWIVAIAEAYFVLGMLDAPITLPQSLALESVIFAVRGVVFMVPGALGIQEGGYVLVGAALGIPSEAALALALVKRARELSMGLPSLVAWQWMSASCPSLPSTPPCRRSENSAGRN